MTSKRGFQHERRAFVGWCGFLAEGESFAFEGLRHMETCRKCSYERRQPPGMRAFLDLGSDVHWAEHGGKWGRKAANGDWFVVRFDVADYDPSLKKDDKFPYEAEVLRLDSAHLADADKRKSALETIGWKDEAKPASAREGIPPEQAVVEGFVASGYYEIVWSERAYSYPTRLRAEARRFVEGAIR